MANKIGWTDVTCNPGIYGCEEVSPACKNCYAAKMAHRQVAMGNYPDGITTKRASGVHWSGKVIVDYDRIGPAFAALPKRLKQCEQCGGTGAHGTDFKSSAGEPRYRITACTSCKGTGKRRWRVFVTSMADLFHKDVPFAFIDAVFVEMIRRPHIVHQVLTKRVDRALEWWRDVCKRAGDGLLGSAGLQQITQWPDNVWMGCTIEDQKRADERLPDLCSIPASVRFVSYEPALGPVDFRMRRCSSCSGTGDFYNQSTGLTDDCQQCDGKGMWQESAVDGHSYAHAINWVIAGGESGGQARPSYPHWFTDIRDQCQSAGVPYYFKQWGEWVPLTNKPTQHRVEWLDAQGRTGAKADNSDWRIGMHRVGRKAAGRSLYGQTWSQFPFGPPLSPTEKPELAPFYRPWRDTP